MIKFLDYIQKISSSEEEFLAVIQEMNRWIEDEKQRIIHVPHNLKRFNFSREEYKQALKLSSQAIQSRKSYREIINKNSPSLGRIKTLAILYYFMGQKVWIPKIDSTKLLLRNESILRQYRVGKTYSELAQEFTISEHRIRVIIHLLITRSFPNKYKLSQDVEGIQQKTSLS